MRIPLYICHVPCTSLRKKSRYFEWRLKVEDEKTTMAGGKINDVTFVLGKDIHTQQGRGLERMD